MGLTRRYLVCFAVGLTLAVAAPAVAVAEPVTTPTPTWGVDGSVNAVAVSGSTAFVGGTFRNVGPNTGGFALVDPASAVLSPSSPPVLGAVHDAIPDGAGGWYLGGSFTHVGGLARRNLAHVLADGSVDPNWAPSTDGLVLALGRSGDVIYAGGEFTTVNGGTPRVKLAAFDATTGAVTTFAPGFTGSGGRVNALVVTGPPASPIIIAGGIFNSLAGVNLSAFDAAGGIINTFSPNPDGEVTSLATCASTNDAFLYAAGSFANIGAVPRSGLASFESPLVSSTPTAWNPNFAFAAQELAASPAILSCNAATVYVGGADGFGGSTEVRAFNATSAAESATFDANLGSNFLDGIRAMALQGGKLYVAGDFAQAGDPLTPRITLAAFDATSGTLASWDPARGSDNVTFEVASGGPTIAIGGGFSTSTPCHAYTWPPSISTRGCRRRSRLPTTSAGSRTWPCRALPSTPPVPLAVRTLSPATTPPPEPRVALQRRSTPRSERWRSTERRSTPGASSRWRPALRARTLRPSPMSRAPPVHCCPPITTS